VSLCFILPASFFAWRGKGIDLFSFIYFKDIILDSSDAAAHSYEVYVVEAMEPPGKIVALEVLALYDDRKTAILRALRVHKVH
jgi:hypothetical protein